MSFLLTLASRVLAALLAVGIMRAVERRQEIGETIKRRIGG